MMARNEHLRPVPGPGARLPARPPCLGARREVRPPGHARERVPEVPARIGRLPTRAHSAALTEGGSVPLRRTGEEALITFIVVADMNRARIFCSTGDAEATEVETLARPERPEEAPFLLTAGRRRRIPRRRPAPPGGDPGAAFFAGEIAAYLRLARLDGVAGFIIAAPAVFLGLLRSELDADTQGLVQRMLTENLCDATVEAIRERLRQR